VEIEGKRILMFQIPAGPRNIVVKFKGFAYGRNGESLESLSQDKIDEIRNQSPIDDWSAHKVEGASISDLDDLALAKARIEYKKVHSRIPAATIDSWSIEEFLTKCRLMRQRRLTRAAVLLLGREDSEVLLAPAVARITWTLTDSDDRRIDYTHFSIPFILTVDQVLSKIRNLTMREMPGGTLFPDSMLKYDDYTMREALHNCIAHQDYRLQQRVNLLEFPDYLVFSNGGTFIPGTVENVLDSMEQQRYYRNLCLCQAMVDFNMIDTISHGIQTMFANQKKRHFPMPDYMIDNDKPEVKVKIYGKAIDDRYTELLKSDNNLSLKECIWLDAIQKKRPITDAAIKILRDKRLIEGRKPHYYISIDVAQKTHQITEYTNKKGLEKQKLVNMILQFVENSGEMGVMLNDIYLYMEQTLSAEKSPEAKKRQLSNLLFGLKKNNKVYTQGLHWHAVSDEE
jgi:ATP-dependent DNA helicase RecG